MARKPPKAAEPETPDSPERAGHKKLLEECRQNFKLDVEADKHNRDSYREALKFCYVKGEQWEASVKKARGPKRVTREFNETRVKVKAVVNHIRSNRPAAKISPVEQGDVETAEAMQGLWLNVLNTSDMDNVTDFAAETQVAAGMGAWMIDTEYAEDSVSDQDIFVRSIRNPLCLVPDRACKEQDKSDARHWNLYTNLSKTAYEAKYGKKDKIASFEADDFENEDNPNTDDDSVWVTAYWRKEPITKNLCLLSTGETVDKDSLTSLKEGVTIVKERQVNTHKIVQYICSATEVLERNEWAGKLFPFVVVYGEYVVVDGKVYWSGMTQTMMDSQRSHNEMASGVYETISSASQAKNWATVEQAKGLMDSWAKAVDENVPVMLYNADPKAPGPPARVGGADVPAALMQAMQMSRDSINSVSSVPDANVGLTSNESSGKAIRARQDSGLVGTYNYSDNIAKAIGRTCKIFLDLAPKVIDTPRALRILGKEGAEKYITVNQRDPITGQVLLDLSKGKYDFVITQGPNAATQRAEAAETLTQLAQADELLMPTAADLVYESMDFPGAKAIAERRKLMLPPPIQQSISQGKPLDPQAAAALQQAEQAMAQVQEQGAALQQQAVEVQSEQAAVDKAKADLQVASANLKTQEAALATKVAEFQRMQAEAATKVAEKGLAEKPTADVQAVVEEVQDLEQRVNEALIQVQQRTDQLLQAQKPTGTKTAVSRRIDGGFETVITDQATGETKVAISKKVNGQMVTQIQSRLQ